MADEESTHYWRNHPQTEKTLRQWLKMESGAYSRPSYIENYERSMQENPPAKWRQGEQCSQCDYVATTEAEVTWHESRNAGHECHPGPVEQRALCGVCGNVLDDGKCRTLNCPRFEG